MSGWFSDACDHLLLARDRLSPVRRFAIFATAFLLAAWVWTQLEPAPAFPGAVATKGRVVDLDWETERNERGFLKRRYALTVAFLDRNGVLERQTTAYSVRYHGIRPGADVRVHYDPEDPSRLVVVPGSRAPLVGRALLALAILGIGIFLFGPLLAGGLVHLRQALDQGGR